MPSARLLSRLIYLCEGEEGADAAPFAFERGNATCKCDESACASLCVFMLRRLDGEFIISCVLSNCLYYEARGMNSQRC